MQRILGLCFIVLIALAQMALASLVCCLDSVCLGQTNAPESQGHAAIDTNTTQDCCCANKQNTSSQHEAENCNLDIQLGNTHWLKLDFDRSNIEVDPGTEFTHQIQIPMSQELALAEQTSELHKSPKHSAQYLTLTIKRSTQLLI